MLTIFKKIELMKKGTFNEDIYVTSIYISRYIYIYDKSSKFFWKNDLAKSIFFKTIQKQSSIDVLKICKILVCTLKIKAKLLMLTWDNVLF